MADSRNPPAILIATLGVEAQVVSACLDLLLQQKENILELWVIHTTDSGGVITQALDRLVQSYQPSVSTSTVLLRLLPIIDLSGSPLSDVSTPSDAQAAFRFLFRKVAQAKKDGYQVHLSITGGRKLLSIFGMECAQMLFDDNDRLWYLYSGGEFLNSKRLHPLPGDDVRLVEAPFIPWSRVPPMLTGLGEIDDPLQAAQRIRNLHIREKIEQSRAFLLGSLTPAEQRVVQGLVQDGVSDQELANRLGLSPRTIEQHLRSAYQKAANHWELEDVNRTSLVSLLTLYYHLEQAGLPGADET
jgi:CRISPR-associated protein Csx14